MAEQPRTQFAVMHISLIPDARGAEIRACDPLHQLHTQRFRRKSSRAGSTHG